MEEGENTEPVPNVKKRNEREGLRKRRGNRSEKDKSQVDGLSTEEITKNSSKGRSNLIAIPSAEVRDAIKQFHIAIDHAIQVVNMTNKVNNLIDSQENADKTTD